MYKVWVRELYLVLTVVRSFPFWGHCLIKTLGTSDKNNENDDNNNNNDDDDDDDDNINSKKGDDKDNQPSAHPPS